MALDQIHLGDTFSWLKTLPANCVDLVVSSPPYNLGKEYEAKVALAVYLDGQTEVLRECSRVLKPGGSIFWQVGAFADRGTLIPLDIRFFPILEECGLTPRNRIVWVRQHGVHGRKKFSCRHETLLWFTNGDEYFFDLDQIRVPQKYKNKKAWKGDKKGQLTCNPLGKNPGDIWLFRNVKHNHEEQTVHPCQFPEDMVARIILSACPPQGVVLDPYMGAGTVAVVARDHGRHYLGAELEPRYHAVALRRLSGEPDAAGCFPNLKTLRDYVEKTGRNINDFCFDKQVGKRATDRSRAKILSEEHHSAELEKRLAFEESSFGADLRGEKRPNDPFKGGKASKT